MNKIYNYRNCVITVTIPNTGSDNVRKATESFLKKVVRESQNDNNNTTRIIKKE